MHLVFGETCADAALCSSHVDRSAWARYLTHSRDYSCFIRSLTKRTNWLTLLVFMVNWMHAARKSGMASSYLTPHNESVVYIVKQAKRLEWGWLDGCFLKGFHVERQGSVGFPWRPHIQPYSIHTTATNFVFFLIGNNLIESYFLLGSGTH